MVNQAGIVFFETEWTEKYVQMIPYNTETQYTIFKQFILFFYKNPSEPGT